MTTKTVRPTTTRPTAPIVWSDVRSALQSVQYTDAFKRATNDKNWSARAMLAYNALHVTVKAIVGDDIKASHVMNAVALFCEVFSQKLYVSMAQPSTWGEYYPDIVSRTASKAVDTIATDERALQELWAKLSPSQRKALTSKK